MNQQYTDPSEFIQKQLDVIKELNTKELGELKKQLAEKSKKIEDLTDQLAQAHDRANKSECEFMHKSKEMEITIKELELGLRVLEEDRDRIEGENTMLFEELFGDKPQGHREVRELKNRVKETMIQNDYAKKVIEQLRSKSKRLKTNLQKAESINNHNIMLLQTQFEKEQNKWEKEKGAYLQEIHILKRKTINMQHLLQKYQHNELLQNNSCWSCSYSANSNQHRVPLGVLNKCNDCIQRRQTGCCNHTFASPQNIPNFSIGTKDCCNKNTLHNQRCLRQSCNCLGSERSENDFINPLLTQDSRQPQTKMFSTYCDTSRKASRNSYHPNAVHRNLDSRSMMIDRQEAFQFRYACEISENNPMCDSDSPARDSSEHKSRNGKGMTQSKSFNNLLRNSHFKLHAEEEPAKLYQHLNEFKKFKQRSATIGNEGGKNSSKEYNSSIHQCKPTCSHRASSNQIPRHLTEECNRFEIKEDVENCITNGSETVSSKFNGINPHIENGFVTYSNISAVPNTHEDDIVYSSTEGRAAEMISKNQFANGNGSNTHSHKLLPRRYNDSFGQNELRVDTSPNALLLKDICEAAACTVKYTNYQNHAMMKDLRKLTGSKSTKNLSTTSFMRPKRTVSINLFPNENED